MSHVTVSHSLNFLGIVTNSTRTSRFNSFTTPYTRSM